MKKLFSLFVAVLLAGSLMANEFLNIDFKGGQGQWTINNVELGGLQFVWAHSNQYGMKATGYVSGVNHATEAWLISPAVDLSSAIDASLAFRHARRYGSLDQLSVLARADAGAWTVLDVDAWPDGKNWDFIEATADLSAFAGQSSVQVAFKYTSTTSGGPTWEIETVTISDAGTPEPPAEDADVVFIGADFDGPRSWEVGGNVTATKGGVTVTCDNGAVDEANKTLRCWYGGRMTISSPNQQIGKLVFQFYSDLRGDLDDEVVVNANTWYYVFPSHAYIQKLSVYLGDAEPIVVEMDTVTVAEAVEIAKTLNPAKGSSMTTNEKYAVKGYVVKVPDADAKSYYMADEKNVYGPFTAYHCATIDAPVAVNDYVIVTGKIMHYYGESWDGDEYHNYEISGGVLVHAEAPQSIDNIEFTEQINKIIVNGELYIVRDGSVYTPTGARIR